MSNDDPGAPPPPPTPPLPPSTWSAPGAGEGAPYGQPQQHGAGPQYPQPAYGAYGYAPYAPPQTEGTATGALVAAIVSWVFCPVIAAIVALVLAPSARRKIEESGGRLTGLGLLTAAKWIAWLNIVFYIGIVLLGVLAIVFLGSTDGGSSDFSVGALGGR